MRKKLLSLLFLIVCTVSTYAVTYYVSPTGNNTTNNGTSLTTPFQTIQKASDVAVSGDIVFVRAGNYREAVDIKANGVTFQPYNNEVVTINGTDLLTSWTLTSGNTYQTSAMTWDLVTWGSNQLFCDGNMIQLARWPDQTSADIVMPTNAVAENVTASGNSYIIYDAQFNEPDGRWVGATIWINLSHNGYDGQGNTWGTITSTSQSAKTITVDIGEAPRLGDQPWGLGPNTEYYLFNPTAAGVNATGGVNALLSNGEWWKNGSTLYVKTPNGTAPSASGTGSNVIEAKRRHFAFYPSVIRSGYTIKGFNLFACSITTDINASNLLPDINYRQVIQEGANGITIDGIKAKYVSHQTDMSGDWQDNHYGYTGIVISGRNNTIKNCTIQWAATSAISVTGADNKILNNTIYDTNYMVSNSGSINTAWKNLDCEIANNTIYNTTQMAINFRYSQNSSLSTPDKLRIHHNTIYNFLRRAGDSGAIDCFGQNLQWARIDHNIIYNNTPVTGNMISGIYLDFGGGRNLDLTYATLDHNVIYRVPEPILISSTRFVNVYNNVCLSSLPNHEPILNANGSTNGADVKIYNNICSARPNWDPSDGFGSYNLSLADCKNNIINAAGSVLTTLFTSPSTDNYTLASTAAAAIDMGISVAPYNESPLTGLPDIGAYESNYPATTQELAFRWSRNTSATSDLNKVNEPILNDGNTSVDVGLNGGSDDDFARFESAGLIFPSSRLIGRVEFVQGTYGGSFDNGSFDAGLRVQFTTDGVTWTDASGWTLSPAYAYLNTSITGVTYAFTGTAVSVKGVRITGQVHNSNTSGSWEARVREVRAISATATNIAASGTAYFWNNIPLGSPTSNTSRGAAAGIKDGVLTVDVPLTDVTANGNWQAFGYTWNTAQSIGSIKYYNGQQLNDGVDNGTFTANMKVQSSTNGTAWTDVSGWTISPAYPYSQAASNQIYILSGPVISGVKGIRVIGQVRTNNISWSIKIKELQVYATTGGATMDVSEKQELSKNINDEVEVEVYPNPARNEFSVSTKGEQSNITILSIDGRVMGRASGKGILNFNSSNWSSGMYLIKVDNTKGSTIKKLVVVK